MEHRSKPSPAVQPTATPPRTVPPAEQQPTAANVQFSQGNLSIEAQNSSLSQILMQVSHDTGMSVEGLNHDERIYGNYGPGSVTATLTKLLDGAGYDYVIVGGEDGGAPAKLLLTASNSPAASTSPAPPANSPAPASPAPAATAPPAENPAGVFVPPPNPSDPSRPKTPQEIFDELRKMHSH